MTNNFQILFDKYEVIKPLGKGSFGSVFLVRHISLNQLRAVKVIPRNTDNISNDFIEARILKELNHPGIPRIFDIEQDKANTYLIEEYIDGQSLDEFLLQQQFISKERFFTLCIELCDIFIYLHSRIPNPIIYRDLKPEHIIVCRDHIKLIDFGISVYVSISGNNFNHLGNVDFSAPEVFNSDQITLAADVFSIGKLMGYIYTYLSTSDPKVLRIIHKASNTEPGLRFETVEALESELKKLFERTDCPHLYKKISVVSSFPGCGCTHIAVSITSALRYLKSESYYFEKNESEDLHNYAGFENSFKEKNGISYYRHFAGIPKYGAGITIPSPATGNAVYDFGYAPVEALEQDSDFINSDFVILICSGIYWSWKDAELRYEHLQKTGIPVKIICNLCSRTQARQLAAYLGTKVIMFPFAPDPFRVTKAVEKLVHCILPLKGGSLRFLNLIKGLIKDRPQ